MVAWARAIGHADAADLLQETLDEEKAADAKLSSLAEQGINQEAAHMAHAEEDPHEAITTPVSARTRSSRTAAAVKASRR